MKKENLLLIVGVFFAALCQAQNIGETLQYSQQETLGTARYRSLSGAFGALGGDLTALSENPAGSAVFKNSFGSVTLSGNTRTNDVSYFKNTLLSQETNLNFNQLGAVFVFANNASDSGINKLTLALTYNQTADFRDLFVASGLSNTSVDSYFLTDAGNFALNNLLRRPGESLTDAYLDIGDDRNLGFAAQQAFLALEANIIVPVSEDPENTEYRTTLGNAPFDQQYTYTSSGFAGKFTANLGLQVAENYYFGLNLNSHSATSTKITEFSELDNDPDSPIDEVIFRNNLTSISSGFSLNLGVIAKVTDQFRAGLSYESPTWNTITEEISQRLTNILDTDDINEIPTEINQDVISRSSNNTLRLNANPNVVTILPDYQLRTPGKLTASAAILFGKQGLISFGYSYKDYSNTRYSDEFGSGFNDLNIAIKETFKATSAFRVGGEYRQENWSYRAGFRYEESPYKTTTRNPYTGSTKGYAIGLGYNFGKIKVDLAYDRSEQNRNQEFYPNSGFTNTTQINSRNNSITATLSLNL